MSTGMDAGRRPLPTITSGNRGFWDAALRGELRLQRCGACGHLRAPVAPSCPRCLSSAVDWELLSGRGEIFACAVYHRAFGDVFGDRVPYAIAIVQLDEGPRMVGDIVGDRPAQARVGRRVEVVFDTVTADVTVPRFRLAEDTP
jgi:uncharacterized OB-fold protein